MLLSQPEADRLLQLPKEFDPSRDQIEFWQSAFRDRYDLFEINGRDRFLLDLERSQIRTATLKFQTRARTVFILARLDINGTAHRNPQNAPHRPGQRLVGTDIHLYREGFGDRVAFLPNDVPEFSSISPGDDVGWLVAFLRFSGVQSLPTIQTTMI
jgi:hypothetical protein